MTGDLSDLVIENKGQLKAVRNILTSKSGRPRKPETMPLAVFIRTVLKRNDCI